MIERRVFKRYESRIPVVIRSTGMVSGSKTTAFIGDISKSGAKVLSPIFFTERDTVAVEIEILGGPMILEGDVVGCRDETKIKERFERTYAVHIQFHRIMSDDEWKTVLALK